LCGLVTAPAHARVVNRLTIGNYTTLLHLFGSRPLSYPLVWGQQLLGYLRSKEKPQDSSSPAAFCRSYLRRASIDNDVVNRTQIAGVCVIDLHPGTGF